VEECPDSNYQSDPVTTRRKHDLLGGNVVYKYDTDVLNNTASVSNSQQTDFPGVGEPIGDVNGFEQESSNLWDDPWAPLPTGPGFIASWLLVSKVPKSRMKQYFASSLGNSESVYYGSMYMVEKHLREFDPCSRYLQ